MFVVLHDRSKSMGTDFIGVWGLFDEWMRTVRMDV